MSYSLFDHVNEKGENEFKRWSERLEKSQLAKLNQKLDMLVNHGSELPPSLLSDTDIPGIKKLRIRGNVQLRPLLCVGPINNNTEFTLLLGAIEKGDELLPRDAVSIAERIKHAIVANPSRRRTKHERVN